MGVPPDVTSVAGDDRFAAIRQGDRGAFDALVEPWIYRIYDVALVILGSPAAAAEVSRETIESLWDRHHDLSAEDLTRDGLLIATRGRALARLDRDGLPEISTTNEHVALARAAAVVLGADEVSYLDLYLRHGVDAEALAPVLGVSSDAVAHRFALTRADLGETMAAVTLWNGGRPTCLELATALGDTTDFDAAVSESIERHRQGCPECARRHRSIVNPERLFVAAPVVAVSPTIRERIVATAVAPTEPTRNVDNVPDRHVAAALDDDDPWAASTVRPTGPTSTVTTFVPRVGPNDPGRLCSWLGRWASWWSEASPHWPPADHPVTYPRSATPRHR